MSGWYSIVILPVLTSHDLDIILTRARGHTYKLWDTSTSGDASGFVEDVASHKTQNASKHDSHNTVMVGAKHLTATSTKHVQGGGRRRHFFKYTTQLQEKLLSFRYPKATYALWWQYRLNFSHNLFFESFRQLQFGPGTPGFEICAC